MQCLGYSAIIERKLMSCFSFSKSLPENTVKPWSTINPNEQHQWVRPLTYLFKSSDNWLYMQRKMCEICCFNMFSLDNLLVIYKLNIEISIQKLTYYILDTQWTFIYRHPQAYNVSCWLSFMTPPWHFL